MRKGAFVVCFVGIFGAFAAFGAASHAEEKAKPIKPIDPEKLGSFLKEFPKWKADGPPEPEVTKTSKGTYTEATRYYLQDDKELEVTVIDGAGLPDAYEDYQDWKEEMGSGGPDTVKAAKVAGHPALEIYEPDMETATLMVLVKDRILVILEMDEATPKDDLKPLADRLDWKGLEKLISSDK